MTGLRFLFRLHGVLLIFIGVAAILLGFGFIILPKVLSELFYSIFSDDAYNVVEAIFGQARGLLPVAGIFLGALCLALGGGLSVLQSWARTIGMAFSGVMGFCIMLLAVALYKYLDRSDFLYIATYGWGATISLILIGLAGIGLLVIAYLMGTEKGQRAFSDYTAERQPLQPVKCPTCGDPMDLRNAICPRCDKNGSSATPMAARLVSLLDKRVFPVSLQIPTRIGRDNPKMEIQLDDTTISAEHAEIEYVDGHFFLHALHDKNGTYIYVDNQPVRILDQEIRDGDLLAFGRAQFQFLVK